MTVALPFALGCPSCPYHVVVSAVDPEASLSELHGHICREHAAYAPDKAHSLLANARELTEEEVGR